MYIETMKVATSRFVSPLSTHAWSVSLSSMMVEIDRQNRRRVGKSDTTDAVAAARAALSGSASVMPKTRNGPVEPKVGTVMENQPTRHHQHGTEPLWAGGTSVG
jgi:hypothetical protein